MKLSRFLLFYGLYALAIAGVSLVLQAVFAPIQVLSGFFWLLFFMLFVLTLTAYVLSDFGIKNGGEMSVYSLMGGIFIKMLFSLGLIAFIVIKYPENKVLTAFNFFSLYILFTVFEVTFLLRNLRHQNKT